MELDWADVYAELSFWYGMSFSSVNEMPLAAIQAYLDRLPKVKADFKIELNEVVMRPHMEGKNQKSLHDSWQRSFFGEKKNKVKKAKKSDLAQIGIGF